VTFAADFTWREGHRARPHPRWWSALAGERRDLSEL